MIKAKENTELLDLAIQTLCITRIIKEYCASNMGFDKHCENIFAIMELMEKNIANTLENY